MQPQFDLIRKGHFDQDFTETYYENMLRRSKENYNYIQFKDYNAYENFILLRHDVDFSLSRALSLAKIEASLDVRSTFFIDIHSAFYNLFEHSQFEKVKEIISLGHDIGLHFDANFYEIFDENTLQKYLLSEVELLENLYNIQIGVFSFHNPSKSTLKFDKAYYGDMLNCYGSAIKDIKYCSDSNGYWRFERLEQVLDGQRHSKLHINLHPGWWQTEVSTPREKVFRTIYGRANANMNLYEQSLKATARVNQVGDYEALLGIRHLLGESEQLLDYLWNTKNFRVLCSELNFILQNFVREIDISDETLGEEHPFRANKTTLTLNGDKDIGDLRSNITRIDNICAKFCTIHEVMDANSLRALSLEICNIISILDKKVRS